MLRYLIAIACVAALGAHAAPTDRDLHDYWDARCASCHGHAAQFARKFLNVKDGILIGTHHRDNLELFLRSHYLTPDLYAPTLAMLKAQVATRPLFKEKCGGCHGTAADFARQSLILKDGVLIGKKNAKPVNDFLKQHGKVTPEEAKTIVESLTRIVGEVKVPS